MNERKPVLIVEDHRIMRDSLLEFLADVPGVEICGVAATGEDGLRMCRELHPRIALIDVSLPGMSGLDLAEQLHASDPLIATVMLSGHQEVTYVRRAVAAGARGYILKGEPADIVAAINEVAHGRRYFTAQLRPAAEDLLREREE